VIAVLHSYGVKLNVINLPYGAVLSTKSVLHPEKILIKSFEDVNSVLSLFKNQSK